MSEKKLTKLQGSDLAIGIQYTSGLGREKSLALTAGVPLNIEHAGLNLILDKMAAAIDRQELRYRLEDKLREIEKYERDLETNRSMEATYRSSAVASWEMSGRRGEFQPNGKQKADFQNYINSEKHSISMIKIMREQVADMRKKIQQVEA